MRQGADSAGDLAAARERAIDALRDGREDQWLREVERHSAALRNDPFLALQRGVALARLDRLSEAEASFRSARALSGITDEQSEFAGRQLQWLEEEWRVVGRGRSALWRARGGVAAGLAGLVLLSGFLWVLSRRERRKLEP